MTTFDTEVDFTTNKQRANVFPPWLQASTETNKEDTKKGKETKKT